MGFPIWLLLIVCLAWVFFRSPSVAYAGKVISQILFEWGTLGNILAPIGPRIYVLWALIGFLEFVQWRMKQNFVDQWLGTLSGVVRWAFYIALVGLLLYVGDYKERDFIYFQF